MDCQAIYVRFFPKMGDSLRGITFSEFFSYRPGCDGPPGCGFGTPGAVGVGSLPGAGLGSGVEGVRVSPGF